MPEPRRSELVVWGIGTARTFRVHWMLHELGLSYRTEPIQSRSGETEAAAYQALNPRGKIPALVHGDLQLAESAAIVLYLADRFGEGRNLAPASGTDARAIHEQWCFFIMTELDAHTLYVVRRHQDLAHLYGEAPVAVDAARTYFQRQVSVCALELSDGRPFLLGEHFTCVDILLGSCLDWARFIGEELTDGLEAYRARLAARAAYGAAFAVNFPPEVFQAARDAK
jgi:glutathione S-transferase